MKKQDVIKLFDLYLKESLFKWGYKPFANKYEAGYINLRPNGDVYFLGMGYHSWWNEITGKRDAYRIEPYLVICLQEIENIIKQVTNVKNIDSPIGFRTFNFNIASAIAFPDGIIKGVGHNTFDWKVFENEDVLRISSEIELLFENILPQVINNLNTIEKAERICNHNIDAQLLYTISTPDRCLRGIIAAQILKKDTSMLIKYYDSISNNWSESAKNEYAKLKILVFENKI